MAGNANASIQREYRDSVLAWLHLVRVHSRIVREEQALLSHFGLTPAQFDVLSHLATSPGLSQTELAERLIVTKGNVGGLIDRLERDGLVERRANPGDRRSNQLYLTDAGCRAFAAAAPELEAHLAAQFEGLDAKDLCELRRLLAQLDRELRRREQYEGVVEV